MRVAILHDYLNQLGGAETVLEAFLELFPEADLYTLLYDRERTNSIFEGKVVRTSFLDLPFVRNHHRPFIPLLPFASNLIRGRGQYDLIISSTTGYAKGFAVKGEYHLAYCHTILPYAWEDEYLKTLPFIPEVFLPLARKAAGFLRNWDRKSVPNVHQFIANSQFVADRIKKFYGRDAQVIYPPVDQQKFYCETNEPSEEYYLMAGRLVYYKRFDLGIRVFEKLKKKLKIVGGGFAAGRLKTIADSRYIEFLPYVSQSKLRELYSSARGLIFPQIEHFGLVAAEAQMCGLPVLAFNQGGALEIIEDRKSGLFFKEQTVEALAAAVQEFEQISFDRSDIAKRAGRFSKEIFKDKIKSTLRNAGIEV